MNGIVAGWLAGSLPGSVSLPAEAHTHTHTHTRANAQTHTQAGTAQFTPGVIL